MSIVIRTIMINYGIFGSSLKLSDHINVLGISPLYPVEMSIRPPWAREAALAACPAIFHLTRFAGSCQPRNQGTTKEQIRGWLWMWRNSCVQTVVFHRQSWTTGISGRYLALTNSLANSTDSIQVQCWQLSIPSASVFLRQEELCIWYNPHDPANTQSALLCRCCYSFPIWKMSSLMLLIVFGKILSKSFVKGIEAQTNAPQCRGPRNAPTEIWEYLECH
jgi:hypothetical protein